MAIKSAKRLDRIGSGEPGGEGDFGRLSKTDSVAKNRRTFTAIRNIELTGDCLSYQTESLQIILNFGQPIKHSLEGNRKTIFGNGMLSEDGHWVHLPAKACWIGKGAAMIYIKQLVREYQ